MEGHPQGDCRTSFTTVSQWRLFESGIFDPAKSVVVKMAHEIAKLILEHAESFTERTDAVRTALRLGMTLTEIQEYLDWVDLMQRKPRAHLDKPRKRESEGGDE